LRGWEGYLEFERDDREVAVIGVSRNRRCELGVRYREPRQIGALRLGFLV